MGRVRRRRWIGTRRRWTCPGGRRTVQFFVMRACCSGRKFHRACWRQTQQAFLEAHVAAFADFGGVFARLRYDNLGLAVKRVLRGRRREETERFIALRSHYLFVATRTAR